MAKRVISTIVSLALLATALLGQSAVPDKSTTSHKDAARLRKLKEQSVRFERYGLVDIKKLDGTEIRGMLVDVSDDGVTVGPVRRSPSLPPAPGKQRPNGSSLNSAISAV